MPAQAEGGGPISCGEVKPRSVASQGRERKPPCDHKERQSPQCFPGAGKETGFIEHVF